MHWIFRKEGRDEQRGLSQSERQCVYFFFVMWKWPHRSLWTLTTTTNSNTDTTGKSVTFWELFLLCFHLDSPQFLVNFTSNTSACLNPAKENKEKNCSLWAEEERGKERVCHPSASATHKRGTRHAGGNRIKTKELQGKMNAQRKVCMLWVATGSPQTSFSSLGERDLGQQREHSHCAHHMKTSDSPFGGWL